MQAFLERFLTKNLIATLILAAILITIRYCAAYFIRKSDRNWSSHQRRRWIGSLRSSFFILILLGVIFIWGKTIQGFAVSVFAIAFAFVYSIKELCMSLNGSIIRFRGHVYDIGDRIEIAGVRGDVIDISILTTTLLELGIGPAKHKFTGRRIVIPNGLITENFVANESFLEHYYMNNIKVPLKIDQDWKKAKRTLLTIAEEESASYIEKARKRIRKMERNKSLELPPVEPSVSIHLPNPSEVHLHLRLPAPTHLKERLEQVIISRFLEAFYSNK